MTVDARISVNLPTHPKTQKLIRRQGAAAAWNLICLFLFTAANRSDGDLGGMDAEDIEIAAGWQGVAGTFVQTLCEVGFLDGENGSYSIHDWQEHNPWAAGAKGRGEASKFAALCKRYGRAEAANMMPDYANRMRPAPEPHAPRTEPQCEPHAPLPSPLPSPSPTGGAKRPAARATQIPADWQPNERNVKDAQHRGYSDQDIARIAEHFRDHHLAKGTLSKSWDASWRTWLANETRFTPRVPARKSSGTDWDGALAAAQDAGPVATDVRSAWDASRVIDGEWSPSAGTDASEPASVSAGGTGLENLDEGLRDSERGPGGRSAGVSQDTRTLAARPAGLGCGADHSDVEMGIEAPDAGGHSGDRGRGYGQEDDVGLACQGGDDQSLDLPAFLDRRHKLTA